MIGRLHRYPQQKNVITYRLLVGNSPDVFLRKMAIGKGVMHLAFVQNNENLSGCICC